MASKCPEEFNPWPPFVDVFSSVILVMLLFLLILFVNVGYYAQFKFKMTKAGSIDSHTLQTDTVAKVKVDELVYDKKEEIKNITEQFVAYIDIIEHIQKNETSKLSGDNITNDSVFSGGKSDGMSLTPAEKTQALTNQKVERKKKGELIIKFINNDIFVKSDIITQIENMIKPIFDVNPDADIELMVGDPQKIASMTLAKQISLGRILNIRNKLKKKGFGKDKIKLKYHSKDSLKYNYGYIKVNVR
jgi:hypothetical protein